MFMFWLGFAVAAVIATLLVWRTKTVDFTAVIASLNASVDAAVALMASKGTVIPADAVAQIQAAVDKLTAGTK